MGLNLTQAVAHAIEVEEMLQKAGYEHEAAQFHYQWDHCDTIALEAVIDTFRAVADAARAHPRRCVVAPRTEPPMFAAQETMTDSALAGCEVSQDQAAAAREKFSAIHAGWLAERERRAVD